MADTERQFQAHLNVDGTISGVENVVADSYVFVSMADDQSNENKVEKLTRHDAVMKKFVEELENKFEVLAIYTGKNSPVGKHTLRKREAAEPAPAAAEPVAPAVAAASPAVPAAPAAQSGTTTTTVKTTNVATPADPKAGEETSARQDPVPIVEHFINVDQKVLVYWHSFAHTDSNNEWIELDITDISVVNETSSHYELKALTSTGDILFNIEAKLGGWDVENFRYANNEYRSEKITVNNGFSYHCGPGVKFSSKVAEHRLIWRGLQLEPRWNITGNFESFSQSWDCVGFVSPAIWAGLFVTLILIAILSCGLSWVFDIKTMDRFDDPKGKTIIVTETD